MLTLPPLSLPARRTASTRRSTSPMSCSESKTIPAAASTSCSPGAGSRTRRTPRSRVGVPSIAVAVRMITLAPLLR